MLGRPALATRHLIPFSSAKNRAWNASMCVKMQGKRGLREFCGRGLLEKGSSNSHPHPGLTWKGMKGAVRILCSFEELNTNLKQHFKY